MMNYVKFLFNLNETLAYDTLLYSIKEKVYTSYSDWNKEIKGMPTLIKIKLTSFEELLTLSQSNWNQINVKMKFTKCTPFIVKIFTIIFARPGFMSYRFLLLTVFLHCFCLFHFFEGWGVFTCYLIMPLPSWQIGISWFHFPFLCEYRIIWQPEGSYPLAHLKTHRSSLVSSIQYPCPGSPFKRCQYYINFINR